MPRITAPTNTSLRRNSLRSMIAPGLREVALTAMGVTAAVMMLSRRSIFHARIDGEVQEVDRQIDENVESGDHQKCTLDHRIIAPQDRRNDEVADARQAEDRFGHDRAADQQCEGEAEDGYHRNQRVAQ